MGKMSLKEAECLKTSGNLQMICVAVTHLDEGLNFEKLLTLKVEKPLICMEGTWRQTVSINRTFDFVLEIFNKVYNIEMLQSCIKRYSV
jgi:hypothetical protein